MGYYRWNGGWGYLKFDALGLYYAHGRWYNSDTGMWLSPNEKGDYLYGGDGPCVQDALNCAWTQVRVIVYFPNHMCDDAVDCEALMDLPSLTGGWGYQLTNDQTLGLPNWILVTGWQQRQGYSFYKGQQGGRLASEWVSKILIAHGTGTALAGTTFLPPTAAAAATCTAATGVCVLPSGVVIIVDLGMIGEGTLEAAYGANVLMASSRNPIGNLSAERQRAVREAWKQEKELVEKTGKGSRDWTAAEKRELIQTGKVKGYEGHHINDAHTHPDLAGDPNNIEFVKGRQGNLFEHGGNFQNPTTGPLIDRERMLRSFLSGTGGP